MRTSRIQPAPDRWTPGAGPLAASPRRSLAGARSIWSQPDP
ncbi:MAG: hypothetical protein QF890_14870 [Myxococcota bacterium]|nr:hypothetical protein [Myxococcota bacterium]